MSDRVRDGIQQTLQAFGEQGLEVKVISGDNLETVAAIAAQAGINIAGIYTGQQLKQMSGVEFDNAVRHANLFARIEPGTKRAIVGALKRQGAYVAMVGDGVNDVPALKEAHLAIAMNDGAQIARSVADIVLLNNSLSTLPIALSEGKSITQKIFGTARLYLSKNIYQLMLFILVSFMSLPFPINPVQISWFGSAVVNLPATLLAFGIIRPALVRRFNREVLGYVVISGVIGALGMALFYTWVYLTHNRDTALARSSVLLFMILLGLLIFLNTQGVNLFRPRTIRAHWQSACLSMVLGAAGIAVPFLVPDLFHFVPPTLPIGIVFVGVFGATAAVLNSVLHQSAIFERLKQLIA
jgi:cation-transporting ATPase E